MGILKIIEAVRGIGVASVWYQIKLLGVGGGMAPDGTGLTSSGVRLASDGELQAQADEQGTGCPLEESATH